MTGETASLCVIPVYNPFTETSPLTLSVSWWMVSLVFNTGGRTLHASIHDSSKSVGNYTHNRVNLLDLELGKEEYTVAGYEMRISYAILSCSACIAYQCSCLSRLNCRICTHLWGGCNVVSGVAHWFIRSEHANACLTSPRKMSLSVLARVKAA